MTRPLLLAGILVLAIGLACSSGAPQAPRNTGGSAGDAGSGNCNEHICDGSFDLRFATTIPVARTPRNAAEGGSVMIDLGARWLYVTGNCQYFVHDTDGVGAHWRPVRWGLLDAATETQLTHDFFYADWLELAGDWGVTTLDHPGVIVFHDRRRHIAYVGNEGTVPESARPKFEKVRLMAERQQGWVRSLYESGTDVIGPVRLMVISGLDGTVNRIPASIPALEWPLAAPIEDFVARPVAEQWVGDTASHLITDATALEALRAGRRRFLAGELGDLASNVMVTVPKDSNERYFLFFRDTTTLEDERGLIPVP